MGLMPNQRLLMRDPLDGAHALMSGYIRLRTVGPDSPGPV